MVENFLHESKHTKESLLQYLKHANVVARVGNTLFVHGAVDIQTIRFVPRMDSRFENPIRRPPPGETCDNVDDWIVSLNRYLRTGLRDFAERPHWDDARSTRGGEALMALQNRSAMWGRSIVSNCYGDIGVITTDFATEHRNDPARRILEEKDPLVFEKVSSNPMDSRVASWLLENQISRVVVGHKPTGDCPAVLSAAYTGVEICSADTSFSDMSAEDNRGAAVSNVELIGGKTFDNNLEISGSLRDGKSYHSIFNRLHRDGIDETIGDNNLGKKIPDGWWVKSSTPDHYLLCRGKVRKVEYNFFPIS